MILVFSPISLYTQNTARVRIPVAMIISMSENQFLFVFMCCFYIIGIHHIPHIHGIHHMGGCECPSSFFGIAVTAASVVRNIPARDIASSRAILSTFFGSIIHESIIFTKVSSDASYQ
jgi:hypothetical protein